MLEPAPTSSSTAREDGITLALAAALVGGMFLDGYAHVEVIDTETEDFFTPWHAVFYTAFVALAGWVAFVGYRRRHPGVGIVDWFPAAYRPALVGVGLFAVGGVGDGIWHTIYGVETSIDALLSPTHLLLFAGGLLIGWTPVRAHALRGRADAGWLTVGTAAIVTAVLVFFTAYAWVVPQTWMGRQLYDPDTGQGTELIQYFLAAALVDTAILLGPLLMVVGRWRPPFGAATVVFTVAQTFETLAFSGRWWGVVFAAIGGAAFDVALRWAPWRPLLVAAASAPAAMWASYLLLGVGGRSGWPPELNGGLVLITALAGAGLTLLQGSGQPGRPEPGRRPGGLG